ncbi:hypothetical protein Rhal01_03485 [Rubritalea halochordaticola]|uniref:PDZ domain-containing protein n=1 Tax=Rubritalea halochordaticola TaxID=714537 RepID=A0ABP9V3R1_9BACT
MRSVYPILGILAVGSGIGYIYLQSEQVSAQKDVEQAVEVQTAELVPATEKVKAVPAEVAQQPSKPVVIPAEPKPEKPAEPEPHPVLAEVETGFDFAAWQKARGQKIDLKAWGKYNPSPYRSYFNGDNADCVSKWYVNLGPLGVTTRMHDRAWGNFSAVKKAFPKGLCDQDGSLIWNHFEVVTVKPGSPADGVLKPGDRILAMDGEYLKGSQRCMLDRELGNRNVRGLELHAGEVIDRAESVGEITLIVLPSGKESGLSPRKSDWQKLEELKPSSGGTVEIKFPSAGVVRLKASGKKPNVDGLRMTGPGGSAMDMEMKRREGIMNHALEVPGKDWAFKGPVSWKSGSLSVEFRPDLPKPEEDLAARLETVTLKLDKIGSFGSHFDPNSEKAYNYSRMLMHRLLVQQEADGSWKAGGYASLSFHTSISGLALMSTGDRSVMPAVKKAAYYVASSTEADKWTYSNGVQLLFLAEYYLYSGDQEILPSLRRVLTDARRFVLSDFTSGHSYMRPGYGGSGYIGGGGALCCGLAVACKTPVANAEDQDLLHKMLSRVQEIAPAGLVPYGRGGKKKAHDEVSGQGGGCGSGPYFVASLLGSGGERFTEAARERFSTAPFGTAENGHATQTLHFFWSVLSSCLSNQKGYQGVMDAYLWKFTLLREYDGLVNKNNYRVEYHNGDGVIGEPYWRTAAYLILMNVHRKQLAMTGKEEYLSHEKAETALLYNDHKSTKLHMIRNWALVDAHLGSDSPASLKAGLKAMQELKEDFGLEKALTALFKQKAPQIARDVMRVPSKNGRVPSGQLAELVMGIHFDGLCTADLLADLPEELEGDKAAIKEFAKKKQKELARRGENGRIDYRILIQPHSVMQAEELGTSRDISTAIFPIENLKVELGDGSRKFFKNIVKSGKDGSLKTSCQMADGESTVLKVRVSYRCAGLEFKYVSDFEIPASEARNYVPALVRVPVKGTLLEDYYGSYSMGLLLSNKVPFSCEQRSEPAPYLLEGQLYELEISPGSAWGHDLRTVKLIGDAKREISYQGPREIQDGKVETSLALSSGKAVEVKLNRKQLVKAIYTDLGDGKISHRIEAMVDGEWKLISPRGTSGLRACEPVETDRLRVLYDGKGAELRELRVVSPESDYQGKWGDVW